MRMTTSDEELAFAAAGGDGRAFSLLLERHYDRLFALCYRLTGAREVAEDLTQEICTALPRKLGGFQGTAKFTTWLYRVAVNASHDWRRREATRARASAGWGDWEIARQAEISEARDAQRWLREAMAALPQDLIDTLALLLDEGMTQAEAARVLEISEGTVAWRMSDAKKRLKAMSQEALEDE